MVEHDLKVKHSKQVTDFYGTAKVRIMEGGEKVLCDCGEPIASINGIKAKIFPRYLTDWQVLEVKEFLRQHHFEVGGMSVRALKLRYS